MAGPLNTPRDGTVYDPKRMHQIMALSSLFLLVSMGGWFWHDDAREWKVYQRVYQEAEVRRTREEIREAETARSAKTFDDPATGRKLTWDEAVARHKQALAAARARRDDLAKALAGTSQLQGDWYLKIQEFQFRKAQLDVDVYFLQEARHHVDVLKGAPDDASLRRLAHHREELWENEKKVHAGERGLVEAKAAADEAQAKVDAAREAIRRAYSLEEEEARKAVAVLNRDVDELQRKVKELTEGAEWRNAPIADMLAPSIKIQQILLPHISDDYHFADVWKVDRCTTCHISINNAEYRLGSDGTFAAPRLRKFFAERFPDPGEREKMTRVLAAHPKPDLIAFDASPHPMEKFGCTICHEGVGRSTDFVLAAHTPRDAAQQTAWEKRHHWTPKEHEDFPMRPGPLLQGACWKCHRQEVEIPGAEAWNRGKFLFERAGCYGCHKTAGYNVLAEPELEKARADLAEARAKAQPTASLAAAAAKAESVLRTEGFRRPGPPLTHIADKTDPEWMRKWVENPKSFRKNARMPTFYNLSNSSGPADLLRNDVEVGAIVDYLVAASGSRNYPETALGDAARGKELVESVGCTACHAIDGKGPIASGTESSAYLRDFAPDLAGVGSKLKPAWLVQWVRDPGHYFKNTRMPSLRLSETEAKDVAAHLMTLKAPEFEKIVPGADVPDAVLDQYARRAADGPEKTVAVDWLPSLAAADRVARLDRPAKYAEAVRGMEDELLLDMYRQKVSDRAAAEQIATLTAGQRRDVLGRALVGRNGCYGCHEVKGFETTATIGVEFTGEIAIGSKYIDQLDFGFAAIPRTRESFIFHKLKDPRRYDALRERKPNDRLRMPLFGFTDDEAKSLTLFLSGFVKRKIPAGLSRTLDAPAAAREAGRRIVRESNCKGCHAFDFAKVVFRAGASVKTPGGVKKLDGDVAAVGQITVDAMNEDDEVYEFYFKLLENNPALGAKPGENVSVTGKDKDAVYAALAGRIPQDGGYVHESVRERMKAAGIPDTQIPTFLPPSLRGEGARVQSDWLFDFLKAPSPIRPAFHREDRPTLRMPTFGFTDAEAEALAKWFALEAGVPYPFADLSVRSPETRAARAEALTAAEKIFLDESAAKCAGCHPRGPVKPSGDPKDWGPDLMNVHARLRPDWIPTWLEDPGLISPGTPMPKIPWEAFFNLYPGAQNDRDEVKRAVRDFLMNLPEVHKPVGVTGGGEGN